MKRKNERRSASLQSRFTAAQRVQRAAAADFVSTELDLAMTFCNIALSSHNLNKVRRNIQNATKAHNSALHFLDDVHPSRSAALRIRGKLTQLEDLLRELHIDPTAA
jgi:hypothetical protein